MTLMARIHANRCAVVDCTREKAPDAQLCRDDVNELWVHRLDRQPDGSYLRRRTFAVRDLTGQITSHAA